VPEMSAHRRGEAAGRGPQLFIADHAYGPHQEETAPRVVKIWRTTRARDGSEEVPVPKALLEQRRQINTVAHEQACARREAAL